MPSWVLLPPLRGSICCGVVIRGLRLSASPPAVFWPRLRRSILYPIPHNTRTFASPCVNARITTHERSNQHTRTFAPTCVNVHIVIIGGRFVFASVSESYTRGITSMTNNVVYDNINKPFKINLLDKSIVPSHNVIHMKQIDDVRHKV